jgi:hypothetical protein
MGIMNGWIIQRGQTDALFLFEKKKQIYENLLLRAASNRLLSDLIASKLIFGNANPISYAYHATLLGLKKYLMINSSSSSLVTFPFLFLSMICTYEAISVAVGWKLLFIAR